MTERMIIVTEHARFEMTRRSIEEELVLQVAQRPEQTIGAGKGRLVHQSRYHDQAEGKEMLLRLVVEPGEEGLRVITAYKTSKISKYWRAEAGL